MALISTTAAERLIAEALPRLPIESLPLEQIAGTVLRENIHAERDQPPFDRVAMDGIALDSAAPRAGIRRLRIQATQAAGDPPLTLASREQCVEVMTGAVLPEGCDTVVPVEQITVSQGEAALEEGLLPEAWQYVHRRGSDTRQGALLLSVGTRLAAPEVAVAASAGMARVRVSHQPTIAVISTGNELVDPGEPIAAHQVRRSNVYGVIAALRGRGFSRVADDHVRDEPEALRTRLRFHLDTHEALILSGGVSVGKFDLVPRTLAELGVRPVFHGVAQRPGRPFWFGVAPTGAAVFALPGNPVSTLVCLSRYVIPALDAAMGLTAAAPQRIALEGPFETSATLTLFLPIRTQTDASGRTWAQPCPTNGSGDFVALSGTDGFVELPAGAGTVPQGFIARLYRW
ncbi:MAG: molybdopterin molybdotransferase MoeA [Steroidobacteraceae bacterium]